MRSFLMFILTISTAACASDNPPPPFGATPSARQMLWHQMEYHAFIHFGPNTFTDIEWGHGNENPDVFNPSALDCRQWARVVKDAGMEGAVLTAKHHDGFCLWPSRYSSHTVRESAWRDGKADVLMEFSQACREYGIKFGVYVSPWDRNHPTYFTPEYNEVFKKMLEEVLTRYGDVYYVFFDGAFSLGPDGHRQEYDWPGFVEVVRRCQPDAVIFSDGGPDVRWVGNERGYAAETNWCTVRKGAFYPGIGGVNDQLQAGHEDGELWIPTEVNTSIRPGWFYHRNEDDKVKPLSRLVDIWYHSVGRNGNLLLNLPPDRRGLIHENDIARLAELRRYLDRAFSTNYAAGGKAEASHVRSRRYGASHVLDGDPDTYWAADEGVLRASLDIEFSKPAEVNAVLLQEYIPLGQRVTAFTVEALEKNDFRRVAEGTTVGNRRIVRFVPVRTGRLRIHLDAKAGPVVSNIEVYRVPD